MAARNFSMDLENSILDNAEAVLGEIGLDLPTYIRMALLKLIKEKRIPFDLSASQTAPEAQPRPPIFSPIPNPVDAESHKMAFNQRAPRQTNKITSDMCISIWNEFKRRYSSGDRNLQEASQLISNQTGMNRGSAFIYFTILNSLVDGMKITRTLKYEDLEFFVEKIKTEFPENILKAAISSLEASIPYWNEKVPGSFADKVRRLVERLNNFIRELGK